MREALDAALERISGTDEYVLSKLRENGSAWIVGGWVRDSLLGKNPEDMDIATTLTPDQIKTIFPRSLMVGASFGTAIVRLDDGMESDTEWQVTTLRSEGDYVDGRRPEVVNFLSTEGEYQGILEDLGRRDFTINAMAIDSEGGLIDPYGGLEDLQTGTLKSVGLAEERFKEDGLRVLRAFRFLDSGDEGVRGMDSSLRDGILTSTNFLSGVSKERIGMEMAKILSGENVHGVTSIMASLGVLERVFEGLKADFPPRLSNDHLVNLALLFRNHGGSGEDLSGILRGILVLPKNDLREISNMHDCRDLDIDSSMKSARRFMAVVPGHRKSMIMEYLEKSGTDIEDFDKALRDIAQEEPIIDPLVNGEILANVTGLEPGPRLGRLKEWLHRKQIEESARTSGDVLSFLTEIDWEDSDYSTWESLKWP